MKALAIALLMLCISPIVKAQSSLHISNQQFRDQFLDGINTRRAQGCNCGVTYMKPVAPLNWSDVLTGAAREHAKDMYRNQYFSHDSMNGRTLEDRLNKAGYTYKGYQAMPLARILLTGSKVLMRC